MERNRRRQNTKRKRIALWKRCIAAAAAMVTVLTGLNYDGLANVFAKETSGYQIDVKSGLTMDVKYATDFSNAALIGNYDNVDQDTALTGLTASDGTKYDPNSFAIEISENGTYTYTLEFSVNVPDTEETTQHTEEIEVVVDQIVKPAEPAVPVDDGIRTVTPAANSVLSADGAAAQSDAAESVDENNDNTESEEQEPTATPAPSTTREATPGPTAPAENSGSTSSSDNSSSGNSDSTGNAYRSAPNTLPLSLLQNELETQADDNEDVTESSILIDQYAEEDRDLLLRDNVTFYGGPTTADAGSVPGYSEDGIDRIFTEAEIVYTSGAEAGSSITINGLYPSSYNSAAGDVVWYFTLPENETVEDSTYGEIGVGYRLPENTEIRFYYKAPETPQYRITLGSGWDGLTISNWRVTAKYTSLSNMSSIANAGQTERVMVEFTLPVAQSSAVIKVKNTSTGVNIVSRNTNSAVTSGDIYNSLIVDETTGRYSFVFTMPGSDVTIDVENTPHDSQSTRYFAGFMDLNVGSNGGQSQGAWSREVQGRTRVYAYTVNNNTRTPDYTRNGTLSGAGNNSVFWSSSGRQDPARSGYGLGWYNGGGEPYIAHEKAYSNTGSSGAAWQERRVMSGQVNSGNSTQSVVYDSTGARATVPVSQFTVNGRGTDVGMYFETALYDHSAGGDYTYIPATMSIDVYRGAGQFNTGNYYRQTVTLPTNGSTQVQLAMGGTMTITCETYNGTSEYGSGIEYSGAENSKQGGFGWRNGFMYSVYEPGQTYQPLRTDFRRDLRWFKYRVEVEGSPYAFKLMMSHNPGAQANAVLNSQSGTVIGSGAGGQSTADNIEGSYIYYAPDQITAGYYPITYPMSFFAAQGSVGGGIRLGIEVLPGYSRPRIYQTGGSTNKVTFVSTNGNSNTPLGDDKRFTFTVRYTNNNKDGSTQPGQYKVEASPIQITARYYDAVGGTTANGGTVAIGQYGPEPVVMGHENGSLNMIITNHRPASFAPDDYLGGYEVWLVRSGGAGSQVRITNQDNETRWHAGDVISFDEVWAQGINSGVIGDNLTTLEYDLQIRPVRNDTSKGSLISAKYGIFYQTSWFNTSGWTYNDGSFTQTGGNRTVLAPQGEMATLIGYKDVVTIDSAPYKLGLRSILSGTVQNDTDLFARIYYLAATRAEIRIPDELQTQLDSATVNAIKAWNSANAGTLFTSSNNESHVIGYTELVTTLKADSALGESFQGFRIMKDPDNESAGTFAWQSPNENAVNLYLLGSQDQGYGPGANAVWNAVFGTDSDPQTNTRGRIALVPQFDSETKITQDTDGTTGVQELTGVTTYTGGNQNLGSNSGYYDISAQFAYTGDPADLQTNLGVGGVNFAILKNQQNVGADGLVNNTYTQKVVGYGSISVSPTSQSVTVNRVSGSYYDSGQIDEDDFYASHNVNNSTIDMRFRIYSVDDNGSPSIRYAADEGATYTVYAWTTDNLAQSDGSSMPAVTSSTTAEGLLPLFTGTSGDLAGDARQVTVHPKKITQAADVDLHYTKPEKQKISPETDFTVDGAFRYDKYYPQSLQYGDSAAGVAEIHTAIFKRNPEDTNGKWQLWMFDKTVTNDGNSGTTGQAKVSLDEVTFETVSGDDPTPTGNMNVSYNIIDQDNSITWQWDDGAQYVIVAWNGVNTDFTVNQTNVLTHLNPNPGGQGTSYDSVPSVTTNTLMVSQEADYYVYIPATVILTDDGGYVNGAADPDYAGAQTAVRYETSYPQNSEPSWIPEIEVKVSDKQQMLPKTTADPLTMLIYSADGDRREADGNGYSWLGVLSESPNPSGKTEGSMTSQSALGGTIPNGLPMGSTLPFRINALNGSAPWREEYTGTLTYMLTMRDVS